MRENCRPGRQRLERPATPAPASRASRRRRASTTAARSTSRSTPAAGDAVDIEIYRTRLLRRRRRAPVLRRSRPSRRARSRGCNRDTTTGLVDCSNWSVTATAHDDRRLAVRRLHARSSAQDNGQRQRRCCSSCATTARASDVALRHPVLDLPGVQQLRRQVAVRLELDGGDHRRRHAARGEGVLRPAVRAAAMTGQRATGTRATDYATVCWLERRATTSATRRRPISRRDGAPLAQHRRLHLRRATTSTGRPACATALDAARDAGRRPVLHRRQRGLLEGPLRASPVTGRQTACSSVTRPRRAAAPTPAAPRPAPGAIRRARTSPRTRCRRHVRRREGLHYFPLRVSAAQGQRPHLALHRARHAGRAARPRRSAPTSSAGSGTRASTTGASRPA